MSVFTQKSEIFTIFGIISEPHWDKPLCLELTGIWILWVKLIKVYPTLGFYNSYFLMVFETSFLVCKFCRLSS